VDSVALRRTKVSESAGNVIGFHTDVARKTLRVLLNDPAQYVGGRLLFASPLDGRLHEAGRGAGTVSLHESGVVHGVTELTSGVRDMLFLLHKPGKLL